MRITARLTAILLVFFGLLIVVGGGYLIGRALTAAPLVPGFFVEPGDPAMPLALQLLTGGVVALQGLMLAGAGEALWLLTNLVRHNERSNEYLATIAARGSMTIP